MAQPIISSSVITSSSKAYWMIFLDTMRPTSVVLSRKGRSHSSYRSKSTVVPSGCLSRVKVDVGQIVRLRMGGLIRPDRDISALNCLVDLRRLCWSSDFRSEELDAIVSADLKDLPRFVRAWASSFLPEIGCYACPREVGDPWRSPYCGPKPDHILLIMPSGDSKSFVRMPSLLLPPLTFELLALL